MQQVLSTPMQLGQILASARKSRKLTQQDAAARLNLSQSRISALELDAGSITVAQLLAMSALYGLQIEVQSKLRAEDSVAW